MTNRLSAGDCGTLVDLLTEQAIAHPDGPQVYLHALVQGANLPMMWQAEMAGQFPNDAQIASQKLVQWAESKGIPPNNPSLTTLGAILVHWLPRLGMKRAARVTAIIHSNLLIVRAPAREKFIAAYGIPTEDAVVAEGPAEHGPDILWDGAADEVEFQSWLCPAPDFQDIGYLERAVENARSVCRIDVQQTGRLGTGFLVAPRLVLTNYHVLEGGDLVENARSAKMCFRAVTQADGNEFEGIPIAADKNDPIKAESPKHSLDFALVQLSEGIDNLLGKEIARIAEIDTEIPALESGLHILQHPQGDSMKLASGIDAVANLDIDKGVVRYATRTLRGSSGSPCFNDDWKVVVLHHAQRQKTFGSIREGVLMAKISEEIQGYL